MTKQTITRSIAILALVLMIAALFTNTAFSQATATPTPTGLVPLNTNTPTPAIELTQPVLPMSNPIIDTPRTVSVSGSGTVEGTPDQAVISLGVTTESEDAATALTQNNSQMQSLISALRTEGVAQADIRTLTVQLTPRYQLPSTPTTNSESTITGFTATNMVEVTVRNLDNLGTLLDTAVQSGGNQIQGINFKLSDPSALLDQAREAAMQAARHKAEQLASLAGAQLGVVMTINESSSSPVPYAREFAIQSAASSVPISPGTQTIQVDLQVTWELR